MPRRARLILPSHPHHIMLRSHNSEVAFADAEEYRYFLDNLRLWHRELRVDLYAFSVLPDSVYLILDPGSKPECLGRLMKSVVGRQTAFVNARRERHGTLWQGRYKSSPIQPDGFLLACCRYVELAPLRAGLVAAPEEYAWSSARERLSAAQQDKQVAAPPAWQKLGATEGERITRYREYLLESVADVEIDFIRTALLREQLTGDQSFVERVERMTGRRVEFRGRGRPRTRAEDTVERPPSVAVAQREGAKALRTLSKSSSDGERPAGKRLRLTLSFTSRSASWQQLLPRDGTRHGQ